MGSMVARPFQLKNRSVAVSTILILITIAFILLGATDAFGISRNTVLSRAQRWIDDPVVYSQSRYFNGYRQDCSGYASMSWHIKNYLGRTYSYNTGTMYKVTHYITVNELRPGDGLNKPKRRNPDIGGHIRLFMGWLDDSHTLYVAYEQSGPTGKPGTVTTIRSIKMDLDSGYRPVRYDHITESAPSRNLLRNPTFDTWAHLWPRSRFTDPVWWKVSASVADTATVRRRDVFRTGRNAVEVLNPSASRDDVFEMSQEVTVSPDTSYTVSAWTRTKDGPAGVRMLFEYLDPMGEVVLSRTVKGEVAGIGDDGFRLLTTTTVAPVDGVRARVTFRLAGGTSQVGTATVPGTSLVLDDVSLHRPWAATTIKASTTGTRIGRSVTLSGTVTRLASLGASATVYVKKPGGAWTRFHDHNVARSGSSAIWTCNYAFKRGMPAGTYYFKTVLGDHNGYLGSTSGTVSVRVR